MTGGPKNLGVTPFMDHSLASWWPFWIVLIEGMVESKKLIYQKLIGGTKNLRLDIFSDPIGQFGLIQFKAVQCSRHCRQWASACAFHCHKLLFVCSFPKESESSLPMEMVSPTPCLYNDCDLIYSSGSVHSRITAPGSGNSRVGSTFRSTHSLQSNITERSDKKYSR